MITEFQIDLLFFYLILAICHVILFFDSSRYEYQKSLYIKFIVNRFPFYLLAVTILFVLKYIIHLYIFKHYISIPPPIYIQYIFNIVHVLFFIPYHYYWHIVILFPIALVIKHFKYVTEFQINRTSKIIFFVCLLAMLYLQFIDGTINMYKYYPLIGYGMFWLFFYIIFFILSLILFFAYINYKKQKFSYIKFLLNYLPVYLFIITILLILKSIINSYTFRSHKYHPATSSIEYIYNTLYDVTMIPYFSFWHVIPLWFIALIIKYFKYKNTFQVSRTSKIIFWVCFVVMFYLDFIDEALSYYW